MSLSFLIRELYRTYAPQSRDATLSTRIKGLSKKTFPRSRTLSGSYTAANGNGSVR